ncbi:MAG TPA: DsrE family protein [Gammaproteobacteria bacterium]|nr:DsrE family protein [Gammaproteobacteria bacterium]
MFRYSSLVLGLILLPALMAPSALAADNGFWQNPVIKSAGEMHPLPDAAFQPDPQVTYKAVFSITRGENDPKQVNGGLEHVARAVNVFASAHVPLDHLKFVVIIHGGAVPMTLDNAHYRKEFKTDNPDLKLIKELKAAGVQFAVCGQAVAGMKYDYKWINPDVKIALSALSTIIVLQQQGYALFPM